MKDAASLMHHAAASTIVAFLLARFSCGMRGSWGVQEPPEHRLQGIAEFIRQTIDTRECHNFINTRLSELYNFLFGLFMPFSNVLVRKPVD